MACNDSEGGHPQRIVVIDNMRNRSHLFWRWFSTIPDLEPRNHPYVMPSLFGPDSWLSELRVNDARANHLAETEQVIPQTTIKDSNDTLGTWIASSDEKGKVLFFSEHAMFLMKRDSLLDIFRNDEQAYSASQHNPTNIPDALLDTMTPIFIIRNPVLAVASLWKDTSLHTPIQPEDEDMDLFASLKFSRVLFEYFKTVSGETPLVVDGEDILWRTEELGSNLCTALGLPLTGLAENWATTTEDVRPKEWWIWELTKKMHESTGIIRPAVKPEEPNAETEYVEWQREFGENVAGSLLKLVKKNMPHYEYLRQFRV